VAPAPTKFIAVFWELVNLDVPPVYIGRTVSVVYEGVFQVPSSHKNLPVPAVVPGLGTRPAAAPEPDLTKLE
jgi:hypothetical protein